MTDKDLLQRFIFEKAPIRGEYIHLHTSFQTIISQHNYPEPIKKILGEALAVSGLLSAIIKFEGRLTIQFRGKGRLKMLLAQCDNEQRIRGLVKWEGELTYTDLMESFNEGVLVIMLDAQAKVGGRYQGIVSWQGNSLAESIEGYFENSEQLATKIWLSVDNENAAGLLLQVIPGKTSEIAEFEKGVVKPSWQRIIGETSQLNDNDILTRTPEILLNKLYPHEEVRLFPAMPVGFYCTCSRKKSAEAIALLGEAEAQEELQNKQSIVVTCDFCNKEYRFDRVDVATIFKETPLSKDNLH